MHTSNLFYNERSIALADELQRRTVFSRFYFCNSGAEANEALLKLARRHHYERGDRQRVEIVSAIYSFHGRTMGALSMTGQTKYHEGMGPLVPGIHHVPYGNPEALAARCHRAHGGGPARADTGRGRRGRRERRVPDLRAQALRRARRAADVRRGADLLRPHRALPRARAQRRHPGRMRARQGHGRRLPARRDRRARKAHQLIASRQPRVDLRRQPARVRGRARGAVDLR